MKGRNLLAPGQGLGAFAGAGESFPTPLRQAVGDDHPLDFAGSFPDAVDPEFPVESLGHVLAHVAAPTEDLYGAVGRPVSELRAEELGHGALAVENLDVVLPVHRLRHVVGHEPACPQFGQTVGQGKLDRLVLPDRPAELHAVPGKGERFIDEAAGGAAAARRNLHAFLAKPGVCPLKTAAFFVDEIVRGHVDVAELHLQVMTTVVVHVARCAPDGDTGRFLVHPEQRVAAILELCLEDDPVGEIGSGDMHLGAVEEPAVAVAPRRCLDGVDIAACSRLGNGVGDPPAPLDQGSDEGLHLPGVRRVPEKRRQVMIAAPQAVGRPAQRFLDDGNLEIRQAPASAVVRKGGIEETHLLRCPEDGGMGLIGDEAVVHLGLDLARDEFALDERAHGLLPLPGLRGHRIDHGQLLTGRNDHRYTAAGRHGGARPSRTPGVTGT